MESRATEPSATRVSATGNLPRTNVPGQIGQASSYFASQQPFVCDVPAARPAWFSAEGLLWWTNGVVVPDLVTTSPQGIPADQAGISGPNSEVLFAGDEIFELMQSGFRVRAGQVLDPRGGHGFDAEFLTLLSRDYDFFASSTGDPILARPFFNAGPNNNALDSQLIAFPGLATGAIQIDARSRMYSLGIHYWEEIFNSRLECCQSDSCTHSPTFHSGNERDESLVVFQLGPRFSFLQDGLLVDESLTGVASGNQFRFVDTFDTENKFLGAEFGLRAIRRRGDVDVNLGLQLAVGGTRQELQIGGFNTATSNGTTTTTPGGFLAQTSNSGSWRRTRFSLLPAIDMGIGCQCGRGWRMNVTYSLTYWPNVLRAGEQIDTTINEDFFAPQVVPSAGPNRPEPLFKETDFLAHGISIGFEKTW